jgi:hypothetical protein
MATQTPTHGGLERVIERASTIRRLFDDVFSLDNLPTFVLVLTTMALVTLAERAMDGTDAGFATEWAALSLVALLTLILFATAIRSATRTVQIWISTWLAHARRAREDEKLWACAGQDSRVMNDILWAQGREAELVEEPRVTVTATSIKFEARRRDPSPSFSRYY